MQSSSILLRVLNNTNFSSPDNPSIQSKPLTLRVKNISVTLPLDFREERRFIGVRIEFPPLTIILGTGVEALEAVFLKSGEEDRFRHFEAIVEI
jgi:hypothetical protein